jgi:hypothetical protein
MMPLPKELEIASQEALRIIQDHPNHEYDPAARKKLVDVFFELGVPTADLTRRWLAVLAVKRVLHLYIEPNYPERYYEQIKQFPPDEWEQVQKQMRYLNPNAAVGLAEQVLRAEFDIIEASRIANDDNYYVGYWASYQPVAAGFVEIAGNKMLYEVSNPSIHPLQYLDQYILSGSATSELDWAFSSGDTAAIAWVAYCTATELCEYDVWIKNPVLDHNASLSFWEWWLLEAIPDAWKLANQS